MLGDDGKAVVSAVPSVPVQVTGWKDLPEAGEILLEVESEVRGTNVFSKSFSIRVFDSHLERTTL